jgi:hypothetical protein
MTYNFPIDTMRIARILDNATTTAGKKKIAFTLAMEDLRAGRYDEMTALRVRNCGRKADAAVKKDLFFQSMERLRS